MRADRLLAILLLLQRGGRTTAGELARRLEVSERTIYRDIEALGTAGVPVYAEPGRKGGIRLREGYRTDLSGLSLSEAELVPLLGLSGAFAGIALGSALKRTETKLLMALPADQRGRAEVAQRRIHVDLQRWWDHAEPVPHLATIADAVLGSRRVRISYTRGGDGAAVERTVEPLGLVVQGGTWYVVGRVGAAEPRIYRVSRIGRAIVTDETFVQTDDFDLRAFWEGRKEEFHMTRPGYRVVVRSRGWAVRALTERLGWDAHAQDGPDNDGWTTVAVSFENEWAALEKLLGLGGHVEVVEPDVLRERIVSTVEDMRAIYSCANDGDTASPAHDESPSGS